MERLDKYIKEYNAYEIYDPNYDRPFLVYDTEQGWFTSNADIIPIDGYGFWAISFDGCKTFRVEMKENRDNYAENRYLYCQTTDDLRRLKKMLYARWKRYSNKREKEYQAWRKMMGFKD